MTRPDPLSVRQIRRALKALPRPAPPPALNTSLRVIASHQAARRRSSPSVWAAWNQKFRLWIDTLMRPVAVPAAGGFASAVLLFGMLAPSLATRGATVTTADIPTGLVTEASIKSYLPLGFDEDLAVEITIDDQGRMVDYSVPNGQIRKCPELRRHIEQRLLFTEFNPATTFGQPTQGKVRLWFRANRIEVKG